MKKDNMRHNSNSRRIRGRGNGGNNNSSTNRNNHRRVGNPRVQTFDSNGPGVRVRGTAFQINEKYMTLSRDAESAGDRVLAESCLQHAEHYQRFINEINEKQQQQQEFQKQQALKQQEAEAEKQESEAPVEQGQEAESQSQSQSQSQSKNSKLDDLDQGFLVGGRDAKPTKPVRTEKKSEEKRDVGASVKAEAEVKVEAEVAVEAKVEVKPKKRRAVRKPKVEPRQSNAEDNSESSS